MDDNSLFAKKIYNALREAYDARNDRKIEKLLFKVSRRGLSFHVDSDDNLEWLESESDDGLMYPELTIEYKLKLGDEVLCSWSHSWGAEFVSYSHFVIDGHWASLDLDCSDYEIEDFLEYLKIELDQPYVLKPCPEDWIKVNDYLIREGYDSTLEGDGFISFKIEGIYYRIILDDELICLLAQDLWKISDAATLEQAYIQANKVTCEIKGAKVFVSNDYRIVFGNGILVLGNSDDKIVWASVELFMPDSEAFSAVLPLCLSALVEAVRKFQQAMRGPVDEEEAEA